MWRGRRGRGAARGRQRVRGEARSGSRRGRVEAIVVFL